MTDEEIVIFTEQDLNQIRIFKLSNGEEVISAAYTMENGTHMHFKRPNRISKIMHEDSSVSIVLYKWITNSDDEWVFTLISSIIAFANPDDDMKLFYIKTVNKQVMDLIKEETDIHDWAKNIRTTIN